MSWTENASPVVVVAQIAAFRGIASERAGQTTTQGWSDDVDPTKWFFIKHV